MKLSFTIVAIALIVFTSGVDSFSTLAMFKKSQAECMKEFPITVEELQAVNTDHKYNFKNPSKNLMCYLHCLDTHAEFYDSKGDFDRPLFEKYMKKTFNAGEAAIEKLLANCLPKMEVGADKCEKSLNFIVCLHNVATAL